jgi:hypothetical protein
LGRAEIWSNFSRKGKNMMHTKGRAIYSCLPVILFLALGIILLSGTAMAGDGQTAPAGQVDRRGVGSQENAGDPLGDSGLNQSQPEGAEAEAEPMAVCTPDIPDMVGYWPLNDQDNPASNKIVFSNQVAGNNGSCTKPGCPARLATGKVGAAYTFSPVNNPPTNLPDKIVVPAYPALEWTVNDSFSFETWVNIPEAADCSGNRVFVGRRGEGVLSIWLGCVNETNRARFSVRDNTGVTQFIANGKTAINDGKWHHLVGTRDAVAKTVNLYLDGALETTVNNAIFTKGFSGGKDLGIGFFNTGFEPYYYLRGSLDEVAIYRRALTLANVRSHWNGGAGKSYCTTSAGLNIPIVIR